MNDVTVHVNKIWITIQVEICWRFDGSIFMLWIHRQCVGTKFWQIFFFHTTIHHISEDGILGSHRREHLGFHCNWICWYWGLHSSDNGQLVTECRTLLLMYKLREMELVSPEITVIFMHPVKLDNIYYSFTVELCQEKRESLDAPLLYPACFRWGTYRRCCSRRDGARTSG